MKEEAKTMTEAQKLAEQNYKTYLEIVWGQFKKYPLAYWSMWGILSLLFIAIICPILAFNVPFFVIVPEGIKGVDPGIHFPWLFALFDANVFESGIDIFFNFLIFGVPIQFLVWFLLRGRYEKGSIQYKSFKFKYIIASTAVVCLVASVIYFMAYRQPYVDWISITARQDVTSLFPPFRYSYREVDLSAVGLKPSLSHWLGTDREGRDVFTRLLYGTRISLTIGVIAVAIYVSIGIVFGSLAGYFGGWVDIIVLRLIEVMICFPSLFLILTLRGFIDNPSIFHIMLIIGVTSWPSIARLVRGEFLRLKNQEFVQAARALGLYKRTIILRHILPNALGPLFVAATFGVAGAILVEATLSFLGLGSATAPSWGQILTAGRQTNQYALILAPGFAIFVTVSLLNLLGDGVRDALDPKLRK